MAFSTKPRTPLKRRMERMIRRVRFGDSDPWGRHKPKRRPDGRMDKCDVLDELVREIVLERDEFCVTCGSVESPQCGHFLSRASWATRFHLANNHRQCSNCNREHERDPGPYRRFMLETYGAETVAELERLWNVTRAFSDAQLDEMITNLSAALADLRRIR